MSSNSALVCVALSHKTLNIYAVCGCNVWKCLRDVNTFARRCIVVSNFSKSIWASDRFSDLQFKNIWEKTPPSRSCKFRCLLNKDEVHIFLCIIDLVAQLILLHISFPFTHKGRLAQCSPAGVMGCVCNYTFYVPHRCSHVGIFAILSFMKSEVLSEY